MDLSIGIVTIATILLYAASLFYLRQVKLDTRNLCFIGLIAALTVIFHNIRVPLPTGAAIFFFGMLPIMLLSFISGPPCAILCGIISGLLLAVFAPGWQPIHPLQMVVENMGAMMGLGFAGVFGWDKRWKIFAGSLLGVFLNSLFRMLSGVVFFASFAPEGMGPWAYSFGYHITSRPIEGAMAIAVLLILPIGQLHRINRL